MLSQDYTVVYMNPHLAKKPLITWVSELVLGNIIRFVLDHMSALIASFCYYIDWGIMVRSSYYGFSYGWTWLKHYIYLVLSCKKNLNIYY